MGKRPRIHIHRTENFQAALGFKSYPMDLGSALDHVGTPKRYPTPYKPDRSSYANNRRTNSRGTEHGGTLTGMSTPELSLKPTRLPFSTRAQQPEKHGYGRSNRAADDTCQDPTSGLRRRRSHNPRTQLQLELQTRPSQIHIVRSDRFSSLKG